MEKRPTQINSVEEVLKDANEHWDEKAHENKGGISVAEKEIEKAELIKIPQQVKDDLIGLIDTCREGKDVSSVIRELKKIIRKYPELESGFFKEKLEEAIVREGFFDKKVNPKKPDPFNEVWNYFFDLPTK